MPSEQYTIDLLEMKERLKNKLKESTDKYEEILKTKKSALKMIQNTGASLIKQSNQLKNNRYVSYVNLIEQKSETAKLLLNPKFDKSIDKDKVSKLKSSKNGLKYLQNSSKWISKNDKKHFESQEQNDGVFNSQKILKHAKNWVLKRNKSVEFDFDDFDFDDEDH